MTLMKKKNSSRMSSSCVGHADHAQPQAAYHEEDGEQRDGDDDQAGEELAVDDVIPVDRLRKQPAECSASLLTVDGVEAEGDAQQRAQEGHERHERDRAAAREQPQKDEAL